MILPWAYNRTLLVTIATKTMLQITQNTINRQGPNGVRVQGCKERADPTPVGVVNAGIVLDPG